MEAVAQETRQDDNGDDAMSAASSAGIDESTRDVPVISETKLEVAQKEQRWVWRLRFLTALVLTCVAVAVCLTVFFLSRSSEQQDFEQDFVDLGAKLVSSFEAVVEQRYGILQSFADEITAGANQSWPFVTPPNYPYRADTVARMAHIIFLVLLPRVTKEEAGEWGNYTVANQGWLAEGLAVAQGVDVEEIEAAPIWPVIMNVHQEMPGPDTGPGPYYPFWMVYPATNQAGINANFHNDLEHRGPIEHTVQTGNPTFEKSNEYIITPKDNRYGFLKRNTNIEYQDDPFAVSFVPVFDKLGGDGEVVGVLMAMIYWRDYFDDLLPPGANGVLVILENDCGQQFTYQVDGSRASFTGFGDLHDEKYDYLGTGTKIDSIIGDGDVTITPTPDDAPSEFPNNCRYSIRSYPSDIFEQEHYTDKPWIYAVVLACLFLVTVAVFLLYDYMVERRQNAVMKSAQQSGKLVQSLFPDNVRDRLYAEQEAQEQAKKTPTWEAAKQQEHSNNSGRDLMQLDKAGNYIAKRDAIANLFPETTIFFADIAGFTKWSSTKSPTDVFQLLETLYGAFDAISLKRRVFKVETIGDSYVAVTGLPEPQEDHAVIMVKFANECMAQMTIVTESLSETLGADTADLAMRVGLHSGPVTAGVLRGQKSRFQLFGDTVNTASRMESNGERGRIHASQSTADALIEAGKADWLACREGTVSVKGKGEMQTYWINPNFAKTKSVVSNMTTESIKTSDAE